MADALLIELEGVVIDAGEARRAALTGVLASEGIALVGDEWTEFAAGYAPRDGIVNALRHRGVELDETALELMALRAERAFTERLGNGVLLQEGAAPFLAAAHGRARLAVVTRMRRSDVEFLLGLAGLEYAFEAVVVADDVLDPKPSPEGHARALARLAARRPLAREQCVVLEDARPGIRAARAAGMRCLAVGTIPADHAMEADGWVASLAGQTVASIAALAEGGTGQERVE